MPTPNKGPRMGGSPAHERLMLANLATQLLDHGRITTTETKAKRLRPYVEKLITFGKRGDLHARRQVLKVIRDKEVVHELFATIGPRYVSRPGGYTRIVKIGPRKGDNAPMAIIELVEAVTGAQSVVGEAERARGTRTAARTAPTGATAEAAEELKGESPTAAGVAAASSPDSPDSPDSADSADSADPVVPISKDASETTAETPTVEAEADEVLQAEATEDGAEAEGTDEAPQ